MKKILFLATGGTIASVQGKYGLAPGLTADALLSYIPDIKDLCEVHILELLSLDSTNISPKHWLIITEEIQKNYDKYDGFVISHGTDTMAYTAAALSCLIRNAKKPIIMTGSQRPMGTPGSDAADNLRDSFLCALHDGIKGIYIVFGNRIIPGFCAKKIYSRSDEAFAAINHTDLHVPAVLDGSVCFGTKKELPEQFLSDLCMDVITVKLTPGIRPDFLSFLGKSYKAIIIEGYGLGGLPFDDIYDFLDMVERITKEGTIVVISSQVYFEGSDLSVYEVGIRASKIPGVLQGKNMTTEYITAKLMVLLAAKEKLPWDELQKQFYKQ